MPLIMITKTEGERDCLAKLGKFLDRIFLNEDGSTEGVFEIVVSVEQASAITLSKANMLVSHKVENIRDVTDTLDNLDLHFNKMYSEEVRRHGRVEEGLFVVDRIPCRVGKQGVQLGEYIDSKERLCILPLNFEPIEPGENRFFRLYYEMPHFVNMFPSMGLFQYELNNTIYDVRHLGTLQQYAPNALPINKKYCEVSITLPPGFVFRYANPNPQRIINASRYKLLSNDILDSPRPVIYYDIEHYVSLSETETGDELKAESDQEITLYCEFHKPLVPLDDFETKTREISTTLEKAGKEIDNHARRAESILKNIVRQSWIAFGITVALALLAIGLSLFQSCSLLKETNHDETTEIQAPLKNTK